MTGFININKARGASSAQEVAVIKRITRVPCGHMGTLDPMATGVLPVALGNAARLFDYLLNKRKKYIATFRFGTESDTLDTTGEILSSGSYVPTNEEIESVLNEFIGEINQIPPKYSAKNIEGKRGYQLARAGIQFELPPKKVNVYSFNLLRREGESDYVFEIECGGGTYIRSLARDIAKRLNTVAVMSGLIRTQSGIFTLDNAVETKYLTEKNISNFIIPTQDVIPFPSVHPNAAQAKRLFNGLSVDTELSDGTYKIFTVDGSFYGLAEVVGRNLKVRTKLC